MVQFKEGQSQDERMFYKNQADEIFIVPVLRDTTGNNQSVEISHLQKYGVENTLCGRISTSPIGFISSFLSKFRPCLACAKVAKEIELEPHHRNAKPIYDLDFIVEFASEPFSPDRAHRYIWKNQPMSATKVLLALDMHFSVEEYQQIRLGYIPKEMEQKWFIFLEGDWVYFHRSWTGICMYQIRLEDVGGEYKVAEAWINRDPEQYEGTGDTNNDDYDTYILQYLIYRLLLGRDVTFFVPQNFPKDSFKHSLFFHKTAGAVQRSQPTDPHLILKTIDEINTVYEESIKPSESKKDYPSLPHLSLPDFPTPLIPSVIRTDKTDLLVGQASEMNQMDHLEHNVTSSAIIHYEMAVAKQPLASLAVVAYGYGFGSLPRKIAAEIAVNTIVERFDQSNSANVKTLFVEGFATAAQRIAQHSLDENNRPEALATCSAVFIANRRLYLASLGHCRIFLLRQKRFFWLRRKEVKQISVPHTVLEHWIESGEVKPEELPIRWSGPPSYCWLGEGTSYPDFRLRLNSDESNEQSAANQGLQLRSGDQIFLCTPSIYGSGYLLLRHLDEIAESLLPYSHPQDAVNNFVQLERQADNLWDLTLILLKVP